MTASMGARLMADMLDRNAIQQIISRCETSSKLYTINRTEASAFHLAAVNLTAILEMQTKQETST